MRLPHPMKLVVLAKRLVLVGTEIVLATVDLDVPEPSALSEKGFGEMRHQTNPPVQP